MDKLPTAPAVVFLEPPRGERQARQEGPQRTLRTAVLALKRLPPARARRPLSARSSVHRAKSAPASSQLPSRVRRSQENGERCHRLGPDHQHGLRRHQTVRLLLTVGFSLGARHRPAVDISPPLAESCIRPSQPRPPIHQHRASSPKHRGSRRPPARLQRDTRKVSAKSAGIDQPCAAHLLCDVPKRRLPLGWCPRRQRPGLGIVLPWLPGRPAILATAATSSGP